MTVGNRQIRLGKRIKSILEEEWLSKSLVGID